MIDRNLVSDVVRPDGTLEKYFIENGVPSFLFGEISTVFINLKLMCCPSYMTVFYRFDKSMQAYYDLFQSIGINMRELK